MSSMSSVKLCRANGWLLVAVALMVLTSALTSLTMALKSSLELDGAVAAMPNCLAPD